MGNVATPLNGSQSELLFRQIFENEPECVKLLDRHGLLLDMNAAGLKLVEADSIDQVRGQCIYDMVAPEHRQAFIDATEDVFNGNSHRLIFEIIGLKGTRRWMETHKVPLRDEDGDIISLLAISRDITQRKQSEALLELQHGVLHQLADGGPLCEILDQLCGMVESIVPGTMSTVMLLNHDKRALNFVAGPRLTDEICSAFADLEIGTGNGSCAEAAFLGRPVIVTDTQTDPAFRNAREAAKQFGLVACWSYPISIESGELVGSFAISHTQSRAPTEFDHQLLDTATHLAGIAIQRSRDDERLRFMKFSIDNTSTEVYWVRSDGSFEYVNDAACRSLGYTQHELTELHVWDIGEPVFEHNWNEWKSRVKAHRRMHVDVTHRRKDGTTYPIDLQISHLEYSGQEFMVAFARDITQQKDAEERLQRQRDELAHVSRLTTAGELAAGIAHELNQPLTAIANQAYIVHQACNSDDQATPTALREAALALQQQAVRAGEIVNRLRGFTRNTRLRQAEMCLNDVVREALHLAEAEFRSAKVTVNFKREDELSSTCVDTVQIQQVLINLFRNGIDAMSHLLKEQRRLDVCTRHGEPGYIEVAVQDCGEGIPQDRIDSIFNPFFTTKQDGMGLGLAISRSIVDAHGGVLCVDSENRQGASFRLVLPIHNDLPNATDAE